MDYVFTETDLDYLGVTDGNVRALLLKTTIVGNYYCEDGAYANRVLSSMEVRGGLEIKFNDNTANLLKAYFGKISNYGNITFTCDGSSTIISSPNSQITYNIIYKTYTNYKIQRQSVTLNCTFDDISSIKILGKINICGIIFDGDATLSYGDKSITIQVYDDTGLTVLGVKGVKHIKYENQDVEILNLDGVTYDLRDYMVINGFKLPKLPNLQHPTYGNNYYAIYFYWGVETRLFITHKPATIVDGKLKMSSNGILNALIDRYDMAWNAVSTSIDDPTLRDNYYIIASDHDIYDGDTLYFAKNMESYIPRE